MSDKISLAFCVHSHQPVGNYSWVFETGAQDCYLPFLEHLSGYPDLKMTLHYTGALLEWFMQHRPEFYDLLQTMVKRGQVEIMGGGFYEPILSVIPEDDAQRQIAMLNAFARQRWGGSPRGLWCAERIWDPCLPKKIAGQGIEYTLLDDTHFLAAGLTPDDIHGYYLTEREGFSVKVFPIDMHLRYMIPFKEPHEIVSYLLRLRDKGVRVVTYGDDGEKFGMWPGTKKWVYQDGWLKRFLDAMHQAGGEIEIITLGMALDKYSPQGRVYLPTASYQEMMEWSLFCEQGRYYQGLIKQAKQNPDWERLRAFLRGGIWDNFLAKYPESNRMHKKMLKVSHLVRQYGMSEKALNHVFKSQCNCGYWHGLFGGVYLTALRHAIYENLLKAEAIIDSERLKDQAWVMEREDYDFDGQEEILISGRVLNCVIAPHIGASVCALEYKPAAYSLSNVMMRHPEIYHNKILEAGDHQGEGHKEQPLSIHDIPFTSTEDLKGILVYDQYPRHIFMTHIMDASPDMAALLQGRRINASLTAGIPFTCACSREEGPNLRIDFVAEKGFEMHKHYEYAPEGSLTVAHTLTDEHGKELWMAVEFNLMVFTDMFMAGSKHHTERGALHARQVEFRDQDHNLKVAIESESEWDIVVLPIECASQSESGFEKTFQGWSVFFIRKVDGAIPTLKLHVGDACPS
ncbi:MAG: alpha-amylase/4-alpha-glucanotransferase domain-containing protein [Syntrophaceae bacterium]